jgi:DNA-binding CsgD family transcriptional regulator/tetratricopeptide (TPR) repeat protein
VVDAIARLAERAVRGEGGALTIVGEPGFGKTAVLDEAAQRIAETAPPRRVIRLTGVEAEVELAWSGLAALLDGLLDGLDELAPARAAALRSALAIEGADTPVEPFAVALATRDLLVHAAETMPIVVFVDDLPWVDPPTRRTLSYLARRLQFERIAIVSARRTGTEDRTDTGDTLTLGTVTDEVADAILVDAGVDSPAVRRELIKAGSGIPLVLVEAANMLDADQRAGRADLPDPLPVGRSGQRVVDLVFDRLPSTVRDALVVAAAEPDGDLERILRALSERRLGVGELEVAEDRGVVVLDRDRLRFRHPLMRSAAYHDASRAERRAAHRALAATLPPGSPARAAHLARAVVGPDEDVAMALEEAAEATSRRGAWSVAARSWELASRLSPAPDDRARRLRLAAEALMEAGLTPAAGRLLDRADTAVAEHPYGEDVVERVRRLQLRSRLPPSAGGASEPVATLRAAAREIASTSPTVAVDLLLDALAAYIRAGAFVDMASAVEEAVKLRDLVDDERARRIDVINGALHIARGQDDGEHLLDRYGEMVGPSRQPGDVLFLAEVLAPSLAFLRRSEASEALLGELEADMRARGAVRPLVSVLSAESMVHYGRSFPATVAAATEAVTLAENHGSVELASVAAGVLAMCSAVIGDRELCERAAKLLADVPEPERRAHGPIGLAYLAYAQGRYEEAEERFRRVRDMLPVGHGLIRWETEWIESLIRINRRNDAVALLDELLDVIPRQALIVHGIDRIEGMLAADDEVAVTHFKAAVAAGVADGSRLSEGRSEILWGERLRRARRRGEARVHLERAVELLRGVGAAAFVERAVTELRAAGGVVDDGVASHQLLTPHELQVARLAVRGASNRELAATLFISPRTVEAHLTAIFRKLGVKNRRELAARALADPVLQA